MGYFLHLIIHYDTPRRYGLYTRNQLMHSTLCPSAPISSEIIGMSVAASAIDFHAEWVSWVRNGAGKGGFP